MSLVLKTQKAKDVYSSIQNCNQAKIKFINSAQFTRVSVKSIVLEMNGLFKMVVIKHSGYIDKVLNPDVPGFCVSFSKGIITVKNLLKNELKDNILLQYIGSFLTIESAQVYRWGQHSINAEVERINKNDFGKNENIVSDGALTIDSDFKGGTSEIFNKSMEYIGEGVLVDSLTKHNIAKGFYTSGNEFIYKNKFYIGNYHYHVDTGVYMTGAEHTSGSKRIKKLPRLRRMNGI